MNVQLGKGQINCKMEVDMGTSRSTVSIMLNYQIIPFSLSE